MNSRYVQVAQTLPRWLAMLMIFKFNTWMVFCSIFILSAIAWYFFGKVTPEKVAHRKVILCTLNSWSVFLGVGTNNRPFWSPLRIFFITLALYGMNITTIYTSKLINVFTRLTYEDQVDTIQEIIESNLPIGENAVCFSFCRKFVAIKSNKLQFSKI